MQFQENRHAPYYIFLFSTFCLCLLDLGFAPMINAATIEDYIKALQPPASEEKLMRGYGGTVAASPSQQIPKVNIPLQFDRNSADLLPGAKSKLNQLAKALGHESLRRYKFVIEGHTCDLGSNGLNMELSKRRASSVTNYLISNTSLAPSQFAVQWYGEDRPAEPNVNENARQRNRRVVIRNTLKTIEVALNGQSAELQIFKMDNVHKTIITDGDRLESGSQYSIAFKSATEPYVYICQIDASGQVTLLFPNPDISSVLNNPVIPGLSYQVPESGIHLYLDEVTGSEQFILLTHQMPVQNPTMACVSAVRNEKKVVAETRGVGGIKNVPSISSNIPTAIADTNLQLCEIMSAGATRGVGGITTITENSVQVANSDIEGREASCQGFFLKRYFIHE